MYHLDTAQFIKIWREMSIWFENTFSVVQAYRLKNLLLGQMWRERSILGWKHKVLLVQNKHAVLCIILHTAQFIKIWREMSMWFENTFLVVQAYKLENWLLGHSEVKSRFWIENTKFYVLPRNYIFHPNLRWNVDLVQKHIFRRASL